MVFAATPRYQHEIGARSVRRESARAGFDVARPITSFTYQEGAPLGVGRAEMPEKDDRRALQLQ